VNLLSAGRARQGDGIVFILKHSIHVCYEWSVALSWELLVALDAKISLFGSRTLVFSLVWHSRIKPGSIRSRQMGRRLGFGSDNRFLALGCFDCR